MNNFLYIKLLFVGKEEDGSKFTYEITCNSADGVERISARQRSRSCLKMINDQVLIKKTELCAVFPTFVVEQCMDANEAIEKLQNFDVEYKYKASGCTDQLRANLKNEHEEHFCRFRSLKCPYYMMNGCSWTRQMVDILTHVKDEHLEEPEITDQFFNTI
ncbi:hypothetical protein C0J52_06553 [Blattella germanica]|nr:hypothetical protein C0J52_06553 [Blattella germanica]